MVKAFGSFGADKSQEWALPVSEVRRQYDIRPEDIEEAPVPRKKPESVSFRVNPEEEKRQRLADEAIRILKQEGPVIFLSKSEHAECRDALLAMTKERSGFTAPRVCRDAVLDALETWFHRTPDRVPEDEDERAERDKQLKDYFGDHGGQFGITENDIADFWDRERKDVEKFFNG